MTNGNGDGDLRPYLLLRALPLVLIPLSRAMHAASRQDRATVSVAIMLYVAANGAELHNHAILRASGAISGRTVKHLLAIAATAVVS